MAKKTSLLDFIKSVIEDYGELNENDAEEEEEGVEGSLGGSDDEEEVEELAPIGRRHLASLQDNTNKRLHESHFPHILQMLTYQNGVRYDPFQYCRVCKVKVFSKCQECDVFLCLRKSDGRDCYREFHTEVDLKAKKRMRPTSSKPSRKSFRGIKPPKKYL